MKESYDLVVIGAGAAGMIAAIVAARNSLDVIILEQQEKLGPKLKATGGGRCNLTNTLSNEDFMNSFGKNGKFMYEALRDFNYEDLISFLGNIGVETHIPDGFKVFPVTHNSSTIINALEQELINVGVEIAYLTKADDIIFEENLVKEILTSKGKIKTSKVVVATGGLGYPKLGANGDGYTFAKTSGHKVTSLHPAMIPLLTKDTWVAQCRADTIAKAQLRVDIKKYKNLKKTGDLIFTTKGIRGPVVLDFSREITPLLEKYKEVPILINMLKGMNEEELFSYIKKRTSENIDFNILQTLETLLPQSVIKELCLLVEADCELKFKDLKGEVRQNLVKILVNTPLTINGHLGFERAMITRGGISLKQIDPKTMQSKLVKGLYFCGEVVDLDGPCGGYNLQWSFASGNLAGKLLD
ncbi:NAD(P)/FAD-dependent oxidoreductase [Halarcobacter bivalviorum]|uniref:Aminoacetone oxidase family FAD-binding enzyme n=1 Tax=Halarcobacter bivalviorum TaxID=663364 RepID=A0AAX2A5R7_9BACT|nr:NAD(P)/FAD-dependent oxidoreductase [Halarcobacter bivalviorum]AXH12971.1 flavoprotein, HI0933 family [Halarcobacter bivalviorum]RXK09219.1 aminoacetone oxidase family FAD-binding enzyme [Halarcobacter bivalviorum]